jgi:hypothetical protein
VSGHPGPKRPLFIRLLRLQNIHPSGLLCFVLFEGAIGFAVLLALAELVSWWAVLVLPTVIAALVKINDVVAGAYNRAELTRRFTTRRTPGASARGVAVVPSSRDDETWVSDDIDAPTEILRGQAFHASTRTRRRAMNERAFVPANGGRSPRLR